MKVALDRRFDSGGVARYAADLGGALETAFADVEIATITSSAGRTRVPFSPLARRRSGRAARAAHADVFHGTHLEVPGRLGMPAVVTIHDTIPLEWRASLPSRMKRAYFRRLLMQAFERAARVIVPSEWTRDSLVRRGFDQSKITIVPHGVATRWNHSTDEERAGARARFAGGGRYVATIHSAKPHKNARLLVEVAPALRGLGLTLVSPGHGGADGVSFVGDLDDDELRSFYGGAEVFLFPSHLEGFGLPVLEALACGASVACSSTIGALPYVRAAVVTFPPTDAVQAAEAVASLVESGGELVRDGAREIVREHSVERMARATRVVYDDALGVAA